MPHCTSIVGRYAPSPTGSLHLGNLRTAVLAWLHARLHDGVFLLRMEDLDTPRTIAGSADEIISDLKWLGLDWESPIVYQSQRGALYETALRTLQDQGMIYPCFCSRKDIQQAASAPHMANGVYPGTCANLTQIDIQERLTHKAPAYRVRVNQALRDTLGDFVVKRADGLYAYQLAVVVDDLEQNVTHVVRGSDLADSAERQLYLAHLLAPTREAITYLHTPLMLDPAGKRLSKRDGSESLHGLNTQPTSAPALIGRFMFDLGLTSSSDGVSLSDLRAQLRPSELRRILT